MNEPVKHKNFGNGTVVSIYGNYIEVRFGNELKKFMFPNAFDNNMLETDDTALQAKVEQALKAVGKQYHAKRNVKPTVFTSSAKLCSGKQKTLKNSNTSITIFLFFLIKSSFYIFKLIIYQNTKKSL